MISYVKTKEGREKIIAHKVCDIDYPVLQFKPLQRNHKVIKYATDYICLDTETSHDPELERAWIYQWAVKFKNEYIYGRKPEEVIDLLTDIAEHYKLNDKKKIIILIHNAAYDFQYLKNYLVKYDPTMEVLATDTHSIIQINILGFKILCSYRMTNMSLANLSKNYARKYIKAVGEIDYDVIRYQDSKLIASDWFYMFSDVASQYDGISGYIKSMGYQYLFMCPMTSTGFVRDSCRRASRSDPEWRDEFVNSQLSLDNYNLCNQAFMGGVCILSYKYAGVTIRSDDLGHVDFTSSYPARQILDYMPEGMPSLYGNVTDLSELNMLLKKYCCVFILEMHDVHIKQGVTAPYIPSSKCIQLIDGLKVNGKVVYAKYLSIAICELDFEIIRDQYTTSGFGVSNMIIFKRGKIPKWLNNEIMLYFNNKCTKKDIDDGEYNRSKALLNSIYGMTATAIIRPQYKMSPELMIELKNLTDDEKQQALDRYYRSRNSFMPYQYSIYTTAHARKALFDMVRIVGYDNFIYCDTDSVFYIKTPENDKRMNEYKEECKRRAIEAGAYVGNKYLGMPTDEPNIRAFRGLHAKCYAMEEENESGDYDLQVVIAGIPKKATKWVDGSPIERTNAEELGSIDNLEDGFIFSHCGGTRAIYLERDIEHTKINGHNISMGSGVIIDTIEKEINNTMWTVSDGRLQKVLYMA